MKTAALIIAYRQPRHLYRLVRALHTENTSFYVHVDLKSDLAAFKNNDFPARVKFLEDRARVCHSGFSQVRAMINLLRAAMQEGEAQYLFFLSGSDYPIKSNSYIHDYLSRAYPMNFMNFYPLVGQADWVENITKYHYVDFLGNLPHSIAKPLKVLCYLINRLPYRRLFLPGMVPYRGASVFCLNRATVADILTFLETEEGKEYVHFFESVGCPDEIFFQTLVFNSSHAVECRYYERDIVNSEGPMKNENKAYLHYIDWGNGLNHPTILEMNDFDKLMNSEYLFARKFDEVKSSQLLEAIDHQLKLSD